MSAAPTTKPTREPPAAWQVPSGGSSGSASGSGAPAASTAAWGAAVVHASPAAGPAVIAAALPPPPGRHSGGSAAGQVQAQVQAQAQGRLSLGDTLEDSANVALTSVLHAAPCATRHVQQQHYLGHASLPWASNDRLVSVACKVSPSGLPAASPMGQQVACCPALPCDCTATLSLAAFRHPLAALFPSACSCSTPLPTSCPWTCGHSCRRAMCGARTCF